MSPGKGQDEETEEIMKASDFSGDLNAFLAMYNYQPELTKRLDNLEVSTIDQTIINDIVLWKVNRYVRITNDVLALLPGLKLLKAGASKGHKGDHHLNGT
jgi:hypothetical protein